ncbi:MAG TPA: single-stranded-DNA-specific exonuclease RecJ [Syntrophorhabdaceae bacterium]
MKTPAADNDIVELLRSKLDISHLCARILFSRGFTDPGRVETFLYPRIEDLSDPFLLPDMEKAVARMMEAVRTHEKVCLYGDYDADGVTSVALMVNFLTRLGMNPAVYLPERKEGYGLNLKAVEKIKEDGATLLVCLDCGSTNIEEIKRAGELGMDVIVIDHHEPGEELPSAWAIVNPKMKNALFPTRELAACGVTFFFLLALRRILSKKGMLHVTINLKKELDLVTLGTIADMVPLTGDNRVIVKFGMAMMRKSPRMWLRTFFKSGIVTRAVVDEYTLGFIIIPRINAAGRVSHPGTALDFLLAEDEFSSKTYLAQLQDVNRQRQRIEAEIVKEAIETIDGGDLTERNSIVLFKEGWHIGVIGIVAQKLTELYKKPCIVITEVEGMWKGSGRGGDGVDLHKAIESVAHLVQRFGGHKYACGISLLGENLIAFRDAFDESVGDAFIEREKKTRVDTHASFEELTGELLEFIERASPYGMGNPRPNLLFAPSKVRVVKGFAKIIDGTNRTWRGSFYGKEPVPEATGIHIVASPMVREDMGERFVHLTIKEFVLPEIEACDAV